MGALNLGDPELELVDPTPDIYEMFISFNELFFDGKLAGCEVTWSKRMTTCAGICYFQPKSGYCRIGLSEPLLKLRSRKEFCETLLHEMIHAYLFITSRIQDRDGHGPEFQLHMHRINQLAAINITVYHTFHSEVAHYKQHWWRCNGECRNRAPYYGWVKRAMNRAPGKNDIWWGQHQASCSGKFEKIREPEKQDKLKPYIKEPCTSKQAGTSQSRKKTKPQDSTSQASKESKKPKSITNGKEDKLQKKIDSYFFPGTGYVLGGS